MANKPYSYYAFELLYWCGIRMGELRALTAEDFDFEKNILSMDCSYCLDFFWVYVAYIFVVQKRKNIYAYIIKKQIILRKIIR